MRSGIVLLAALLSVPGITGQAVAQKEIEVTGRIQSRFSQNQWTNFGGFGGRNPAFEENPAPCVGGDCGEFDPRSNEYIKMRGLTARFTPGLRSS